MSEIETAVARHYGDTDLLSRIFSGLEASGADLNRLQPDDLTAVEEFHIGGRKATAHAVEKMRLSEGQHILDVGCGIGGAARYIADNTACTVAGIDLTPEYIDIAKTLTELTGLDNQISFDVASALSMPFQDKAFDAAITLHVAMNIPERAALYSEIARVLKPGSTLYIFDVMKKNGGDLLFPVPWAETPDTSHLTTPEEMCSLLEAAGFHIQEVGDRTDFALEFFRESMEAAKDGPLPLGIHLVMGESAAEKLRNVKGNIENGCIAPVQMVAVRTED
ncbi:MAG TPA: methyltransferase domain-containing protein [Gammaproteobacteria bacterium]|nr:methyltransferase domain-containing protein [Gammaproteobacteria bacterium]